MMTRIFYATDIHGSDIVFRKFVSAGKFYKADTVILDGDLTGKAVVPIVKKSDNTFETTIFETKYTATSLEEVKKLEGRIANLGFYPYLTDEKEVEELRADPKRVYELFSNLMVKTMEHWVELIEQNLKGTGIKCFVCPGNDDRFEIDKALLKSDYIVNPEGKVLNVDDHHEMISTGYSNPTPWNTPREESEEALRIRIDAMASRVENMQNCIFNLHCPPYDSGIDLAPQLNENFRQVVKAGEVIMIPVGSKAVRASIEKHQPLLGLHGHIHESKGARKIDRTLCLNPGTEYQQGILKGIIVNLDKRGLKSYFFTSG